MAQQARAAYDLLAAHPRADTTLLSLWLLGFPIGLHSVRAAYGALIDRQLRSIHESSEQQPDEIVGGWADMFARQHLAASTAPLVARQALADLTIGFLETFYGVSEEFVSEGLTDLWEKVAPYLSGAASRHGCLADVHPSDEDFATWACHLNDMASLKAQRRAINSASSYELMRARRLVLFAFGCLHRLTRAAGYKGGVEEVGRQLLIVFGRPTVPILIAVLRNNTLRHRVISSLLHLAKAIQPPAWPTIK